MNLPHRIFASLLTGVLLFAAGAPVHTAQAQTSPSEVKTLRITWDGSLTLEPGTSSVLTLNTQEGLVRNDPNDERGGVIPGLAASWDVSSDGLTYDFHLRSGLRWSDGTAISADDFAYGFERLKAKEDPAFLNALQVKTLTAVDADTVRATFNHPGDYLIRVFGNMALVPVKRSYAAAEGTQFGTFEHTLYSGPFTATGFADDHVELRKNPNYWDADHFHYDKVVIYRNLDATTSARLYQHGHLDEASLYFSHGGFFGADDLVRIPSARIGYLLVNTKSGPLVNRHIRRALALSIDRSYYEQRALEGLVPPGIWGLNNEYRFEHPMNNLFDVEQAKSELQVGLQEMGLTELPTIVLDSQCPEADQLLAELWRQTLGINVQVNPINFAEQWSRFDSGAAHLSKSLWAPDFNDPSNYLNAFRSNEIGYFRVWGNATYDKLLDDADATTDRSLRLIKLHEAEQILLDDAGVIPLYSTESYTAMKPYVNIAVNEWNNAWDFRYSQELARPVKSLTAFVDSAQIANYAHPWVNALLNQGVINGVGDNRFAPVANVTRAEFVKMIVKDLGLPYASANNRFVDVDENDWYYWYMETAAANKIVQGSQDVNGNWVFRPNDPITRAEIAKVLTSAYGFKATNPKSFIDTASHWANDSIRAARDAGVVYGMGEDKYMPDRKATRTEAAAMIGRSSVLLPIPATYDITP